MSIRQTTMARAFLRAAVCASSLAVPAWALAADRSKDPPVSPTQNQTIASGAVEDTLHACMARIPKSATLGQRMIAEQSCRRDEENRKPLQSVPGR